MRKPRKLWKVGELVRHSGLTRQTIHNYCLLGLIRETEQTPSGHRLYDEEVFERLERIQQLKAQGKGLQEIAVLLKTNEGCGGRESGSEERGGSDA